MKWKQSKQYNYTWILLAGLALIILHLHFSDKH